MSPSDDCPEHLRRARAKWRHVGRQRPAFAHEPASGQESVWDFPRPPRWEAESRRVQVELAGVVVAHTERAIRVLETGGAPTYYLPPTDVDTRCLRPEPRTSVCEWKGRARYYAVQVGGTSVSNVAWCYLQPFEAFAAITGYFAFYPGELVCYLGQERVRPQPGGYYGGWVTSDLAGPIKGEPGTEGW